MKYGILFRWQSAWIGAHYSPGNKRLCVNLLPFVTVWFAWPGGYTPDGEYIHPPEALEARAVWRLMVAANEIDHRNRMKGVSLSGERIPDDALLRAAQREAAEMRRRSCFL